MYTDIKISPILTLLAFINPELQCIFDRDVLISRCVHLYTFENKHINAHTYHCHVVYTGTSFCKNSHEML